MMRRFYACGCEGKPVSNALSAMLLPQVRVNGERVIWCDQYCDACSSKRIEESGANPKQRGFLSRPPPSPDRPGSLSGVIVVSRRGSRAAGMRKRG